jgi:Flp pilus assembly protein TadG
MHNRLLSALRNCCGAVAVEIAVITPIFLLIGLGIVEFGRGLMVRNLVHNAAREGARVAIQEGSTNTDVETWVQTLMCSSVGIATSNVSISITTVPGPGNPDPANCIADCQPGDLINVVVRVPFDKVAFLPGKYLTNHTLTGSSTIKYE